MQIQFPYHLIELYDTINRDSIHLVAESIIAKEINAIQSIYQLNSVTLTNKAYEIIYTNGNQDKGGGIEDPMGGVEHPEGGTSRLGS